MEDCWSKPQKLCDLGIVRGKTETILKEGACWEICRKVISPISPNDYTRLGTTYICFISVSRGFLLSFIEAIRRILDKLSSICQSAKIKTGLVKRIFFSF